MGESKNAGWGMRGTTVLVYLQGKRWRHEALLKATRSAGTSGGGGVRGVERGDGRLGEGKANRWTYLWAEQRSARVKLRSTNRRRRRRGGWGGHTPKNKTKTDATNEVHGDAQEGANVWESLQQPPNSLPCTRTYMIAPPATERNSVSPPTPGYNITFPG